MSNKLCSIFNFAVRKCATTSWHNSVKIMCALRWYYVSRHSIHFLTYDKTLVRIKVNYVCQGMLSFISKTILALSWKCFIYKLKEKYVENSHEKTWEIVFLQKNTWSLCDWILREKSDIFSHKQVKEFHSERKRTKIHMSRRNNKCIDIKLKIENINIILGFVIKPRTGRGCGCIIWP